MVDYNQIPNNNLDKITNTEKKETLSFIRDTYNHEISRTQIEIDDRNLFSWTTDHIVFHVYIVSSFQETRTLIIFCTDSHDNVDQIEFNDCFNETNHYDFTKILDPKKMLSYLLNHQLVEDIKPEEIIKSSIRWNSYDWKDYVIKWVDEDYKNNSEELSLPAIELVKFDETPLHESKYHFSDLLQSVDDSQFKAEFSEMLFAYNNEKFFVAAASLGSILESLMYLTLQNYDDLKLLKTRNPSAKNYIAAFEKSSNISFVRRDSSYFDNIFNIRNSISHYYTGFVLKAQCDMMLHGLSLMYERFYKPSKVFRRAH